MGHTAGCRGRRHGRRRCEPGRIRRALLSRSRRNVREVVDLIDRTGAADAIELADILNVADVDARIAVGNRPRTDDPDRDAVALEARAVGAGEIERVRDLLRRVALNVRRTRADRNRVPVPARVRDGVADRGDVEREGGARRRGRGDENLHTLAIEPERRAEHAFEIGLRAPHANHLALRIGLHGEMLRVERGDGVLIGRRIRAEAIADLLRREPMPVRRRFRIARVDGILLQTGGVAHLDVKVDAHVLEADRTDVRRTREEGGTIRHGDGARRRKRRSRRTRGCRDDRSDRRTARRSAARRKRDG